MGASSLYQGESTWLAKSLSEGRIRDLSDEVRRFRPDAVILILPLVRSPTSFANSYAA